MQRAALSVIVVMLVLASCGENAAIEIVVKPPDAVAVAKVRLHVGLGYSMNPEVARLIPAGYEYPQVPAGYAWKRDENGDADYAEVSGNEARFVFQPGSHDRITVIAVGYSGDGAIVAAGYLVEAIMESGTVRQYHLDLAPATSPFPDQTRGAVSVQEWGPDPESTACAHLSDTRDGEIKSIYVVHKDDPDCDGFLEDDRSLECRPDVFRGLVRPPREKTTCFRQDMVPSSPTGGNLAATCVLGGGGCVDGRGGGTCDASTVCADPRLCGACMGTTPGGLDCGANFPTSSVVIPRIECSFNAVKDVNGAFTFCNTPASLTTKFPFAGPTCDATQPYLFWALGGDNWVASTVSKLGATFTALKPTTDCGFLLTGGGTPPNTLPFTVRALVQGKTTNGRSAVIPLVIGVEETQVCDAAINECHFAGDITAPESFRQCMQAKVVDPW